MDGAEEGKVELLLRVLLVLVLLLLLPPNVLLLLLLPKAVDPGPVEVFGFDGGLGLLGGLDVPTPRPPPGPEGKVGLEGAATETADAGGLVSMELNQSGWAELWLVVGIGFLVVGGLLALAPGPLCENGSLITNFMLQYENEVHCYCSISWALCWGSLQQQLLKMLKKMFYQGHFRIDTHSYGSCEA